MKRILGIALACFTTVTAVAQEKWLSFKGKEGPGKGKHIVLVSGDEEYRSEESAPMLAKILSERHGFDTTVLFAWSEDASYIDPNNAKGVLGWEKLDSADLMIIGTRMRILTPETIKHLGAYLNAGKPVIGFRTATHAFKGGGKIGNIGAGQWGLKILGETWVNHHGGHKSQGARGVIEKGREKHPVLNSVKDVFGPSDVYGVKHLTDKDTVLLRGAVTDTLAPDSKILDGAKNDPMMALAWLHTYTAPEGGKTGRAFGTTMGASVDFVSEDFRRLIVNASFHLLDLDVPEKAEVEFVDAFYPSFYGFWSGKNAKIWKERGLTATDFGLGKSPGAPEPPGSPEWTHRAIKK
ncbi:MAG: hypothetical protein ACI9NQ_001391 [Paracoccaceae bacterium]|jgi:hypothetical protein